MDIYINKLYKVCILKYKQFVGKGREREEQTKWKCFLETQFLYSMIFFVRYLHWGIAGPWDHFNLILCLSGWTFMLFPLVGQWIGSMEFCYVWTWRLTSINHVDILYSLNRYSFSFQCLSSLVIEKWLRNHFL